MGKPRTPAKAFLLTGPALQTLPRCLGSKVRKIIEPSEGEGKRKEGSPPGGNHKQVGTLREVCSMASRWCYVLPDPKCKPVLVEVAAISRKLFHSHLHMLPYKAEILLLLPPILQVGNGGSEG